MNDLPLHPLPFGPIYKGLLWGGRRLADLFGWTLPEGPIGEAWVLSDVGENQSRVTQGPLQGWTLRELMERAASRLLGRPVPEGGRFPLLLKFIDAQQALSVQVHPSDQHTALLPPGGRGKTEAWVVLHAEPDSRIYAGLKPGIGALDLQRALREGTVADCLHGFVPRPGDCIFIPAGTVHALGAGVVLFEVQQSSDVTFRLFDWNRVDARTGQPRQLHIEQALACIDYASGPRDPVRPIEECTEPIVRQRLVHCRYFTLWRLQGDQRFTAGRTGACRILVGLDGRAELEYEGAAYSIRKSDVLLLPAEIGACPCRLVGTVTLLECAVPDLEGKRKTTG